MTRVDFYVLDAGARQSRERLACAIAAKAFGQGYRVFLYTDEAAEAERLDELLWTFRDVSFLPHARYRSGGPAEEPILIGGDEPPPGCSDVLINLTQTVPLFFSRFQRVLEVVDHGDAARAQARDRFRFYRERGYALETHSVGDHD